MNCSCGSSFPSRWTVDCGSITPSPSNKHFWDNNIVEKLPELSLFPNALFHSLVTYYHIADKTTLRHVTVNLLFFFKFLKFALEIYWSWNGNVLILKGKNCSFCWYGWHFGMINFYLYSGRSTKTYTHLLLFHELGFHFLIQWSQSHGSISSKTWNVKCSFLNKTGIFICHRTCQTIQLCSKVCTPIQYEIWTALSLNSLELKAVQALSFVRAVIEIYGKPPYNDYNSCFTWLAIILFLYLRKYWNHINIKYFKDKSDVIPVHTMTAYGGVDVKVTHSLTSLLDTGGGQSSASRPTVLTTQKSLILTGNGTMIPHYANYTMPAHTVFQYTVKSLIPTG